MDYKIVVDLTKTPRKESGQLEGDLFIHSDNASIYDLPAIRIKHSILPDYVREAAKKDEVRARDPRYDEIVLSKWGRREVETNLYAETPEMVFFRSALIGARGLIADERGLKDGERAKYLAEDEVTSDLLEKTRYLFEKFSRHELFPNTPYMSNAGHMLAANYYKGEILSGIVQTPVVSEKDLEHVLNDLEREKEQRAQLFACFVLEMYDNRASIFETMGRAAAIQAGTGGTGFNFSNLRPANEAVAGTGGVTDGPVSFMAAYSNVLGKTMNQGGKREGANMFMLDFDHPDVMRFIYSKRQDGEIPAANISVAVDHRFMEAVKSGKEEDNYFPLVNPHFDPKIRPQVQRYYSADQLKKAIATQRTNKKVKLSLLLAEDGKTVLSPWLADGMSEEDLAIGKVGEGGIIYLNAKKILKHISYGAWYNGEPGVIHLGHINNGNPTHPRYFFEALREEGKLEEFLRERGVDPGIKLEELIEKSIRTDFLPPGIGVIKATNPCGEKPLQKDEACVLGHINLETLLDRKEDESYEINWGRLEENTRLMVRILDNAIDQNEFTDDRIALTQRSNRKIGLGFMGLAEMLYKLEIPYNSQEARDFINKVWGKMEKISEDESIKRAGELGEFPNFKYSAFRKGSKKRNAIVRTLAPTGTTAFVAMTSGGCEPQYALTYTRTTVQGAQIVITNANLVEKLKKYPISLTNEDENELWDFISDVDKGKGSLQGFTIKRQDGENEESFVRRQENLDRLKKVFVTTYDIAPEDHLKMQAVVQIHTDDAISKTTNFRTTATPEQVYNAYLLAHDLRIKGMTFYRDGSRVGQPLEVKGTKKEVTVAANGQLTLEEMVRQRLEAPRPDDILSGETIRIPTPFGKAFLTVNYTPEGGIHESFIKIGKAGGDIQAVMEGFGRVMSAALRARVPPEYIIGQLKDIIGETRGATSEGWIKSLPDAVAQGLARILEKGEKVSNNYGKKKKDVVTEATEFSGNLCPNCGSATIKSESCETCRKCDYTKC